MPSTTTSTGAEMFTGFEEKRWTLRCVQCKATKSTLDEGKDQYEWSFALEGSRDEENGGEIKRRTWTSQIWNETPGKESHLVLVARALCGNQVSQSEFEALDYPDLVGLKGSAMVTLNSKGWPTIDKETFRPVGTSAPKGQATMRITDSPVDLAAPRSAAPRRPGAVPALRSEDEAAEILQLARANEPPMSDADVDAWIAGEYPGQTLATNNAAQAKALIAAFDIPF